MANEYIKDIFIEPASPSLFALSTINELQVTLPIPNPSIYDTVFVLYKKYESIWFELSDYSIALLEKKAYFNVVKDEFINKRNLFYSAAKIKYSTIKLALNLSSSMARICGCYSIDENFDINIIRYLNLSYAYAAAGGTQEVMLQIVSRFVQT